MGSGYAATPHDVVTMYGELRHIHVLPAIDSRIRCATSMPGASGVRGSHTANSSPPIRATRSPSRTAARRVNLTCA